MLKRKYLKTTNTEDDFYSNRNETASGQHSKSNVFTSKHSKNMKIGISDSNVDSKREKEGIFNAKKNSTLSYATQGLTSTKNEKTKTSSNNKFESKLNSKKGLSKNTEVSRKVYHTNAVNSKASSKQSKVSSKNSDGSTNFVFNRKDFKNGINKAQANKKLIKSKDEYQYNATIMSARNKDVYKKRMVDINFIKKNQKQYLTQSNLEIENILSTKNNVDHTLELNCTGSQNNEDNEYNKNLSSQVLISNGNTTSNSVNKKSFNSKFPAFSSKLQTNLLNNPAKKSGLRKEAENNVIQVNTHLKTAENSVGKVFTTLNKYRNLKNIEIKEKVTKSGSPVRNTNVLSYTNIVNTNLDSALLKSQSKSNNKISSKLFGGSSNADGCMIRNSFMNKFPAKEENKTKTSKNDKANKLNQYDKIGDYKVKKSTITQGKKPDSATNKKFTHVSSENIFNNNFMYSIGVNSNKNFNTNVMNQDKASPNTQKNAFKGQTLIPNNDIMIQENNTTPETHHQKQNIIESVMSNNHGLMKNIFNKQDKWKRGEDSSLKKQLKRIVKNQKGTDRSRKKPKSKDHKVDKYHSYSQNSNKKTVNLNNSSGIIENNQNNKYTLSIEQNFKTQNEFTQSNFNTQKSPNNLPNSNEQKHRENQFTQSNTHTSHHLSNMLKHHEPHNLISDTNKTNNQEKYSVPKEKYNELLNTLDFKGTEGKNHRLSFNKTPSSNIDHSSAQKQNTKNLQNLSSMLKKTNVISAGNSVGKTNSRSLNNIKELLNPSISANRNANIQNSNSKKATNTYCHYKSKISRNQNDNRHKYDKIKQLGEQNYIATKSQANSNSRNKNPKTINLNDRKYVHGTKATITNNLVNQKNVMASYTNLNKKNINSSALMRDSQYKDAYNTIKNCMNESKVSDIKSCSNEKLKDFYTNESIRLDNRSNANNLTNINNQSSRKDNDIHIKDKNSSFLANANLHNNSNHQILGVGYSYYKNSIKQKDNTNNSTTEINQIIISPSKKPYVTRNTFIEGMITSNDPESIFLNANLDLDNFKQHNMQKKELKQLIKSSNLKTCPNMNSGQELMLIETNSKGQVTIPKEDTQQQNSQALFVFNNSNASPASTVKNANFQNKNPNNAIIKENKIPAHQKSSIIANSNSKDKKHNANITNFSGLNDNNNAIAAKRNSYGTKSSEKLKKSEKNKTSNCIGSTSRNDLSHKKASKSKSRKTDVVLGKERSHDIQGNFIFFIKNQIET